MSLHPGAPLEPLAVRILSSGMRAFQGLVDGIWNATTQKSPNRSMLAPYKTAIFLKTAFDNWHNVYQHCFDDFNRRPRGGGGAMYVGDILRRKNPRVVTVRMNETIGIAAKLMRANNVGAVVVQDVVHTEGNTTVGMFTGRDAVRAIADRGVAAINMKVSQFISVPQLVSCSSKDTLESVHDIMDHHQVRHLPVIDDCSLVGVISMQDITSALDCTAASAAQAA
jgi:CBS domain-containing protein